MAHHASLFQRLLHHLFRLKSRSSAAATTSLPVLLLVEGRNDAEFLRRASAILHVADHDLPDLGDLERRGQITFVPVGGGDLVSWAYRLAGTGNAEVHIYDREDAPATALRYETARIVNLRPGCRAFVTKKRSLENYLAPNAIAAASGIEVTFGDDDDVADLVAEHRYLAQHPLTCWGALPARSRRRLRNRAKRWLNSLAVDRMTAQQFAERDPAGEIREWLTTIAEMVAGSSLNGG